MSTRRPDPAEHWRDGEPTRAAFMAMSVETLRRHQDEIRWMRAWLQAWHRQQRICPMPTVQREERAA